MNPKVVFLFLMSVILILITGCGPVSEGGGSSSSLSQSSSVSSSLSSSSSSSSSVESSESSSSSSVSPFDDGKNWHFEVWESGLLKYWQNGGSLVGSANPAYDSLTESADAYNYSHSLRLDWSDSAFLRSISYSNLVRVSNGNTFSVQFYAKRMSGAPELRAEFRTYRDNGGELEYIETIFGDFTAVGDDWVRLDNALTVSAQAIRAHLLITGNSNATGSVLIDHLTIENLTSDTIPPSISFSSNILSNDSAVKSGSNVVFSGTAVDNISIARVGVSLSNSGGVWTNYLSNSPSTWGTNLVLTAPLGEIATNTVSFWSEDQNGNISTPITRTIYAKNLTAKDLMISEYIEATSGSEKYIEIFNGTGTTVDLTPYRMQIFANGASNPSGTAVLSNVSDGTYLMPHNSVIVLRHTSAVLYTNFTINHGTVCGFNGNDALALIKIEGSVTNFVDIFGCIGEDPVNAWVSGGLYTSNITLVRKASVTNGVTENPLSGFPTLSTEWLASTNANDVSFLGAHTFEP